MKKVLDKFR